MLAAPPRAPSSHVLTDYLCPECREVLHVWLWQRIDAALPDAFCIPCQLGWRDWERATFGH